MPTPITQQLRCFPVETTSSKSIVSTLTLPDIPESFHSWRLLIFKTSSVMLNICGLVHLWATSWVFLLSPPRLPLRNFLESLNFLLSTELTYFLSGDCRENVPEGSSNPLLFWATIWATRFETTFLSFASGFISVFLVPSLPKLHCSWHGTLCWGSWIANTASGFESPLFLSPYHLDPPTPSVFLTISTERPETHPFCSLPHWRDSLPLCHGY